MVQNESFVCTTTSPGERGVSCRPKSDSLAVNSLKDGESSIRNAEGDGMDNDAKRRQHLRRQYNKYSMYKDGFEGAETEYEYAWDESEGKETAKPSRKRRKKRLTKTRKR